MMKQQELLGPDSTASVPEGRSSIASDSEPVTPIERAKRYPEFRYMGSKRRLLPWIHDVLADIDFTSAFDPFSGSGCVAYLMKCMGKRVVATDFLNFPATLAMAAIENSHQVLNAAAIQALLQPRAESSPGFVERTFSGIFYTPDDLRFIDRISLNLDRLENEHQRNLARSALMRSCLKRQPRGVFTVSGDLSRYDDGRRDLRLSIEEHFHEQVEVFNAVVFDNGKRNMARRQDVFDRLPDKTDLVYLDPPYVPRSDDNCYIKRYHFLEGLSCYWKGLEIDESTKVKKIPKRYTPFSYRRTANDAFDRLFQQFQHQKIVLSYSSNGFPDLDVLVSLMSRYKRSVTTHVRAHRYHFGTHNRVTRASAEEYLIVGE
jgi:DNA adenine methylase/adenine-specific DNA-methyltransferase